MLTGYTTRLDILGKGQTLNIMSASDLLGDKDIDQKVDNEIHNRVAWLQNDN